MRHVLFALTVSFALAPLTARAATPDEAARLLRAVGIPEVMEIMREEGLGNGDGLDTDLLDSNGGDDWAALVAGLYDIDAMMGAVGPAFAARLADVDVTDQLAFFESSAGQRVVGLELAARRAMMDDDFDQAARDRLAEIDGADPRFSVLAAFVDDLQIIESNVVGAMNANYNFFLGMAHGGAFDGDMTEEQILRDVWEQEPGIRADTTEWLFSFLVTAYDPLSDGELDAYIAVSATAGGRALNQAMFTAFDVMYNQISYSMGQGAAIVMRGQDL